MNDHKDTSQQNHGALSMLYDGKNAPHIAAKGYNKLAELIVEKAEQEGILIHKDEYLFNYLQQLEVGQEIPPTMYVVIAELIAFSYVIRGKFPESWQ